MTTRGWPALFFLLILLVAWPTPGVRADDLSARQAMESQTNPLLLISTNRGSIYVELFPEEAPQNVARFISLNLGEFETIPGSSSQQAAPFYSGMRFHRVLPGVLIQSGSPAHNRFGDVAPPLADEINSKSLGLDLLRVLDGSGNFNPLLNITSKPELDRKVLEPLYLSMNITDAAALENQQQQVLDRLKEMTIADLYALQGYSYLDDFPTRPVRRGTLALANRGPDDNGSEFFISLVDSPELDGKYTVLGQVIEGIEVADVIGQTPVDATRFDRNSTLIYSTRLVTTGP